MFRSFSSGLVGIETENNLLDEAFQNSGLVFGESRALRRDYVFNAGFKQRDQIELAFTDDRATCFNQSPFAFVQPKKHTPFLEKRRFRGVQIFRDLRIGLEQSAAERDYLPEIVADRKNDSAAKSIVDFISGPFFITRLHQSALQQLTARIAALERPFQKCVPTVRRKTELPIFRDLFIDL